MADWESVQPDEYKRLGQNFTAGRPWGIKYVTIHHMAGDLDANACNRVWRSAGTSAHYSIDRNGHIVQHVDDTDRAWACGDGVGVGSGGNDMSISIEHANDGRDPWTVYPAALESGAHLTAALCRYYGLGRPEWDVSVMPHSHWSATACPGELYGSQKDEYIRRAQAWYDSMTGGAEPAPAPTPTPAPAEPERSGRPAYQLHYALHVLGGGWWSEVTDWHGDDDASGYAGSPNTKHDMLLAYVTKDGARVPGALKYRVHVVGGGWLPWVQRADYNDAASGMAGNWGQAIDGVQLYFETPGGEEYQQAWYRSQTTQRAGWLDAVKDDTGFAGIYGEPLDRLQARIGTSF